jgi:putative photosynthetic complex assembly protein
MNLPQPSAPSSRLPALAAALVLIALFMVALTRITGIGAPAPMTAATVEVRELRFEDRPDGSIAILDTAGGLVDTVAPGENGFLRGTMRGMARERKRNGHGSELPFQLIGHADGRLTLEDPTTGRTVDLGSFGPTNAAVFMRLMNAPRANP